MVAAIDLYLATGDSFFRDFALNYMERFVAEDGSIPGFELHAYSIDNIAPGRPLFFALDETGEETRGEPSAWYDENWVDPYCQEVWEYNTSIFKDRCWFGEDDIARETKYVKCWMPLPEPPEEGIT